MSGQTIEIINTDAEGRLVLADVLITSSGRFKPESSIDLATLTGAIVVALGSHMPASLPMTTSWPTGCRSRGRQPANGVWRMPLGPEYDKMIDLKFADMKNTGGRHGGSMTGRAVPAALRWQDAVGAS